MSHLVAVEPRGNILHVKVLGRIRLETYKHLIPFIDTAIFEYDGVRILFDLTEFAGRDPDGAVFEEDTKFDLPYWAEVERVAFIGDKKFEPRMPAFCEPFTSATSRFFYPHQRKDAGEWIREGVK